MIEAVLHPQNKKLNSKAARCAENAARFSYKRFREEFSAYMGSITKT
jgi:hypothetical protein